MPRSEVFGRNVRGREAQIFARDIDIEASPIAVCDYGNWVIGIATLDQATPDGPPLPDRFRRALKVYRSGPDIDLKHWL
jgi:hypothetical protein